MRLPELRGSGDFLRREDENHARLSTHKDSKDLLTCRSSRYAKLRDLGLCLWKRRSLASSTDSHLSVGAEASTYQPTNFRHRSTAEPSVDLEKIIPLELPELEVWVVELWDDFLLEPTPYLVLSAVFYLGFTLLLVRYHAFMWYAVCFLSRFIPWDEDFNNR